MSLEQLLLKNGFSGNIISRMLVVFMKEEEQIHPLFLFTKKEESREVENYFHPSVVSTLEKRLGLRFESGDPSNVCFLNHEEVLPDFRTTFTTNELLVYIFAILADPETRDGGTKEKSLLPYPADPEEFWKMVEQGKKKKSRHLSN